MFDQRNLLKTDERQYFNYLTPWLAAVWKLLKELKRVKIGYPCFGRRPQKINWGGHGRERLGELSVFGP